MSFMAVRSSVTVTGILRGIRNGTIFTNVTIISTSTANCWAITNTMISTSVGKTLSVDVSVLWM